MPQNGVDKHDGLGTSKLLGALRMFNFHGMKWPKSKEFFQSERAVGELKVLNFSLGVPLII